MVFQRHMTRPRELALMFYYGAVSFPVVTNDFAFTPGNGERDVPAVVRDVFFVVCDFGCWSFVSVILNHGRIAEVADVVGAGATEDTGSHPGYPTSMSSPEVLIVTTPTGAPRVFVVPCTITLWQTRAG